MEEIWKKIKDVPGIYEISNLGNVRNNRNKLLKPITLKGQKHLCYQFAFKGKRTFRQIHNLLIETFKPEEALPTFKFDGGYGLKPGRPSVSKAKNLGHRTYKVGVKKRIIFIDGNKNNLSINNLKYTKPNYRTKRLICPKRANIFYTGDALINIINFNTTEKNKEDNKIIIKWLLGDNNAIGVLFTKYYQSHKITLISFLKKNYFKSKYKRKENALQLDDFITECQIKIMYKIKKGKFDGRNFNAWSCLIVKSYLAIYFENEKKKGEWMRDKTQSFIG